MSSNWNSYTKPQSIDESIVSNPWENASNNGNITNLVAPNPISPIISHKLGDQAQQLQQQHDDVASIISSLSGAHNVLGTPSVFSAAYKQPPNLHILDETAISDSGSDALRDAISAISAPVANQHLSKSRFGSAVFGPASVAGVNVSNMKSTGFGSSNATFLEKFSSVTEKTRELESTNIGSRRSSMFNNEPRSPQQLFREPRKQSFSEKLESYISATGSPNTSRHLSFSSEAGVAVTSESNANALENAGGNAANINAFNFKNAWNPATATTFHPSFPPMHEMAYMQQQQHAMMMSGFQPMNSQGMPNNGFFPQMFPPFVGGPFGVPPNMMQNPADNVSAMDMRPSDTTKSQDGSRNGDEEDDDDDRENVENNLTQAKDELEDSKASEGKHAEFFPVGLNRSGSPYVMTPFGPYGMFPPNGAGFMQAPGTPVGSPPPMMMPPHMMGVGPVGPRDGNSKGRSGSPPNRGSRSPPGSGKRAGKNSKFKAKHIVRSPLLEEFRTNKDNKTYKLTDIASHGIEFTKDQHGSRFIQGELATATDEEKEALFKEIVPSAMDLMTDVFGNYVIQKYFEYGSDVQKKVLFENMRGSFNTLSVQMYGCRVVQRCLEGVPLTDQLEIMEELKPNILSLVKDQNGNHVIQKAIENMPIEKIPFVLDALRHQIYHLSMHPYGCRVIQRLLECSNTEDQEFILNEVKGFIYYLVQDQFGNYVIQHVIESGKKKDTDIILKVVVDNLVELSKHKFASNAVEKCIINLPTESKVEIYETMLKDNLTKDGELSEQTNLMLMMKDPFANYVVQKMVEVIEPERKKFLVFKIRQYLKLIQKNTHGKHLASIEKLTHICRAYD